MPNDKSDVSAKDVEKIDLSTEERVHYWMKELDVTEERLRQLVKDHGGSADAVRSANGSL